MARHLTPDQERITRTLDRPLFVAAGAGSGKSSTLAERVAWALGPGSGDDGAPFLKSLDEVLVITFTHAAADEIKEKIRARLREGGMASHALEVDSAWISTIHGMCSRILRRHALELGLDPGFKVAGEGVASGLAERAVDEVCGIVQDDPAYEELRKSFELRGRAGSDGASTVFGMLGTLRDAAGSALEGFDSIEFPGSEPDVFGELSTYLDCVQRALVLGEDAGAFSSRGGEAERANLRNSLEVVGGLLSLPPSQRDARHAAEAFGRVRKPGDAYRSKRMRELGAQIRAAYADCALAVQIADSLRFRGQLVQLAREVDRRYASLKFELGVLDNDDLLSLTLRAFREHPKIAAEYGRRFRLVMVDEFQDTNAQQVRMIELLSGPGACHLCTVGDAQQSIYRFRAADVQVFLDRQSSLPASSVVELRNNFRSHDDVLRFVAHVLGRGQEGEETLLPRFMDLVAWKGRESAFAARGLPRISVELVCSRRQGRAQVSSQDRADVMADRVAHRLASYIAAGQRPSDAALLLGRMSKLGSYLEALRARGIECVVSGGSTFSQSEEVHLVSALLHLLANPRDTRDGLYPVLTSQMFRLSADDLLLLATRDQEEVDALAKRGIEAGLLSFDLPSGAEPSDALVAARELVLRAFERLGSWPVRDVLLVMLQESGLVARLEDAGPDGQARLANALAAVRHVGELVDEGGLGISQASVEFDRWLEVCKLGPASLVGGGAGPVQVMTVHASKGLEFPLVAACECWGNDAPASKGICCENRDGSVLATLLPPQVDTALLRQDAPEDDAACGDCVDWAKRLFTSAEEGEAAERARLLYVALTRAREAVILGISAQASKDGSLRPRLASGVCRALFGGDLPTPGEHDGLVDYGGSEPAALRVTCLAPGPDGDCLVDDGEPGSPRALVAFEPGPRAAGQVAGFAIYGTEVGDGLAAASESARPWSPREGIFSYSSVQRSLGATEVVQGEIPPTPLSCDVEGRCEGSGEPEGTSSDADRATSLGSAFHQLAQAMVESGSSPAPERVSATERRWRLSPRQCDRLELALARWEGSDIRREALSHACLRAEQPFFQRVESSFGRYAEGAIDLLCTDPGSTRALVVDYKTGDAALSPGELAERHRMQADLYASVLLGEGFDEVECAFVCVEREVEGGQPLVLRYGFGRGSEPIP